MRNVVPIPIGTGVLSWVDIKTGRVRVTEKFKNLVVYEGIDLLGKLLAGEDYEINTVYFEFNNGGAIPVVPDPTEGRSYYQGLETDGDDNHGYLRVGLQGSPVLSASDTSKFATNRVTFNASSQGAAGMRGATAFSAAAGSVVFGIALVSAPDVDDPTQDIVFSRSYDFTGHIKLVNEEVRIQYSHVFPEEISSSSA